MLNAEQIHSNFAKIRRQSPLVHNITNYVVMNFSANALLAVGASPVMAHAMEEVDDMVGIAGSLVINMGTLSKPWVESMIRAMRAAQAKGIPVVFDPVGVGATAYRNEVADVLLKEGQPAIVRGNASEILALKKIEGRTKGVDSTRSSETAIVAACDLASRFNLVACVSGESDYVVDGNRVAEIRNGHPMMTRVTGMGCASTALIGAFAAVTESKFDATVSAMAVMGVAGEKAAKRSEGPGSLAVHFLDELFNLTLEDFSSRVNLTVK